MREIEFRGKRRFDGKWFFGSLLTDLFETSDGSGNIENGMKGLLVCIQNRNGREEVIPETVGEYTGLKDRNGVRIFEGDVIDWRYIKNKGDIWKKHELVVFENGYFFIKTITEFFFTPGLEPSGTSLYNEAAVFERALIENPKGNYFYKVIGNIHDNPELLEAEK